MPVLKPKQDIILWTGKNVTAVTFFRCRVNHVFRFARAYDAEGKTSQSRVNSGCSQISSVPSSAAWNSSREFCSFKGIGLPLAVGSRGAISASWSRR